MGAASHAEKRVHLFMVTVLRPKSKSDGVKASISPSRTPHQYESKLDMTFASFFEIYEADKKKRVKENTWESKSHVIHTAIPSRSFPWG